VSAHPTFNFEIRCPTRHRPALLSADHSGRPSREGKATISPEVVDIFERIGTTAETCQARLGNVTEARLLGRFPDGIGTFSLAASLGAPGLRVVSQRPGLRRTVNLASCLVI
jgi:hypothetical protein